MIPQNIDIDNQECGHHLLQRQWILQVSKLSYTIARILDIHSQPCIILVAQKLGLNKQNQSRRKESLLKKKKSSKKKVQTVIICFENETVNKHNEVEDVTFEDITQTNRSLALTGLLRHTVTHSSTKKEPCCMCITPCISVQKPRKVNMKHIKT